MTEKRCENTKKNDFEQPPAKHRFTGQNTQQHFKRLCVLVRIILCLIREDIYFTYEAGYKTIKIK